MRTIHEAIDKVKDTLESKGMKYGKTYAKVGLALGKKPQFSILVRLLEKCFRVEHLMRTIPSDKDLANEFLDIACYAILAMFESSVDEEGKESTKERHEHWGR